VDAVAHTTPKQNCFGKNGFEEILWGLIFYGGKSIDM
jgi:hypothetical protein